MIKIWIYYRFFKIERLLTPLRGRLRPHQGHKHRQRTNTRTYAHNVVVVVVVGCWLLVVVVVVVVAAPSQIFYGKKQKLSTT